MIEFILTNELNQDAEKSIIEQIYYLSTDIENVDISENSLKVTLSVDDNGSDKLKADILNIINKTADSFKSIRLEVEYEHNIDTPNKEDVFQTLMDRKDIIAVDSGIFVFQGEFLDVFKKTDHFFYTYSLDMGCKEQEYPTMLPLSSLIGNGYLKGFPHNALMISSVKHDLESISAVTNLENDSPDVYNKVKENLGEPHLILAPTVCYHCFESLKNCELPSRDMSYTAIQKCHRQENKSVATLERLNIFTMRELIFFGSKEYVDESRLSVMEHAKNKFIEWGVKFRIMTASDPFFSVGSEKKRAFQTFMKLKYELQVFIPASGNWISVASFNLHLDILTKSYKIKDIEEEKLYSACVGYGYERMVYGFYSQFGADTSLWPLNLKKDLLIKE